MTENPSTAPQGATPSPIQEAQTKPGPETALDPAHSVKVRIPAVFIYYQMVEEDALN